MIAPPLQTFPLGDLRLVSGGVLADARLTYRCWGALNAAADNVVLLPSYYTGTSASHLPMIGVGRAFDPTRYFIVAIDLFGNGNATSPSQLDTPGRRAAFPRIDVVDNVAAQHRLVAALGIRRIRLVYGWSLAAIQAYFWAAMYPDAVDAILPVCGASRCWPQNRVFLEGLRSILAADPAFAGGACESVPEMGLRAFGRSYAGWAFSPAFYRDELYKVAGFATLEDFLAFWEEDHLSWHAADLNATLVTWMTADIATLPGHGGDLAGALGAVRARCIAMPCDEDRYFTLEENRIEAGLLARAELRPIRSPYGHCAGGPGRFPKEMEQIADAVRDLLEDS
ncbi:homoserine O-acetyltransferase [Ancylobacter sp. 3268]|uniref:alpha/beta fold hydrolase n=1 Tax=Ancylobacter sp. 3268 TaxID=2817752 RepID=UPI00285EDF58|nr:alpha/beta fold hydrolase [Ancylobacter sp. 3268]MDR6954783.1 homoserine O-acetyltransferase [Ancylobacter sp. 3268]